MYDILHSVPLNDVPGLQRELRDAGHEEAAAFAAAATGAVRRRLHVAEEVEVVERLSRVRALELAHVEEHDAGKVETLHPGLR